MTTIKIKQHDTKMLFVQTPTIDCVKIPVADLSGCTLSFLMKGGDVEIKADATLVLSGSFGVFQYQPAPEDVAIVGSFKQEWELTYPSGKILTFPNNDYNFVRILSDLG